MQNWPVRKKFAFVFSLSATLRPLKEYCTKGKLLIRNLLVGFCMMCPNARRIIHWYFCRRSDAAKAILQDRDVPRFARRLGNERMAKGAGWLAAHASKLMFAGRDVKYPFKKKKKTHEDLLSWREKAIHFACIFYSVPNWMSQRTAAIKELMSIPHLWTVLLPWNLTNLNCKYKCSSLQRHAILDLHSFGNATTPYISQHSSTAWQYSCWWMEW